MPSVQAPFISIGLARLRRGVTACCVIAALALLAQLLVWAMATFMDVRYTTVEAKPAATGLVVKTDGGKGAAAETRKPDRSRDAGGSDAASPPDPNRVPSQMDHLMKTTATMARALGGMAMVMLIPFVALGALLGAGSGTPGVERAVSAFGWSMVVAMIVLPLGEIFHLPWREGALWSYNYMTHHVDANITDTGWGSGTFYARFAAMPLACIVGLGIVGFQFSAGVETGIVREDHRLDPMLEREAANIRPTSLHGGRTAAAIRAMGGSSSAAPAPRVASSVTPVGSAPEPAIGQPAPGEGLKRLI